MSKRPRPGSSYSTKKQPAAKKVVTTYTKPAVKRQNAFYGRPMGYDVEKKVSDLAVNTYQVNTTGSFTLLHAPVPGSDMINRVGRKTYAKSIYIRGYVAIEAALAGAQTSTPAQQARIIIFQDNQPNGAVPVVTDLLNTATPASQLNLNNRDRFKIIRDETWELDAYNLATAATFSLASTSGNIGCVHKYMKVGVETIFNAGNAGTIADINSGAIYMFWIGSAGAATNTDTNAIVSTRVRFLDL